MGMSLIELPFFQIALKSRILLLETLVPVLSKRIFDIFEEEIEAFSSKMHISSS